ncbi:MAG: hypothetical protein HC854_00320 [Flavobacterium sp.]|nr:hypothetical protein [Flavobacterium sp.]
MKTKLLFLSTCFFSIASFSQVLNANGPGNTYEEINAFFAPGYTAVESPDQLPEGSHSSFGRHIDEIFDATANKICISFFFHI